MRLRGWTAAETARRFVLHPNTIRWWKNALNSKAPSQLFCDKAAWNRMHDAVRGLIHEMRELCPEYGSKAIAQHIVRAGVQISPTSVRRVNREQPPRPRKREGLIKPPAPAARRNTTRLLKPSEPNRVWHCDLTQIQLLWFRLCIVAVMDGFSRKLLTLRLYPKAPSMQKVIRLVDRTMRDQNISPRFLITDHGCQFKGGFRKAMASRGVVHVRGRIGEGWRLNSKIERLFRTLKLWQRLTLLPTSPRSMQRRLNLFQEWYNEHRIHSAVGGLTPEEAGAGRKPPTPIPIYAKGKIEPVIRLRRRSFGGDPHLPVIDIDVRLRRAA